MLAFPAVSVFMANEIALSIDTLVIGKLLAMSLTVIIWASRDLEIRIPKVIKITTLFIPRTYQHTYYGV